MAISLQRSSSKVSYWDQFLETQSRREWDALKLNLLKKHLKHAYEGSAYYRAKFDELKLNPDKIKRLSDLSHFPTIDKQTLRSRQEALPPLGDIIAVPESEIVYISTSSGSTGVPTASPFTASDFDDWIDYEARQFFSSGLRNTDRYCHALNLSLFVGGPCVLGAQKVGALSIHAGTVPSERLLALIQQFGVTAIWTTPSYAWFLGETARQLGIDPAKDTLVDKIFVAGEPGGSIPETRNNIEALWNADVYDYYGLSDIFGSCAGMCTEKNGLHWAEDHILLEVLDPATGEAVAEGERGELVLTTLRKKARPIIRFKTGDIVSYTNEPCGCGRTAQRLHGVHGRLDDMLIIKGVNVFPSDIESVIRREADFNGEYRLVVDRVNHLDELTVQAEVREGIKPGPVLQEHLQRLVKSILGISVKVELLLPAVLPRATHKAKRVLDNRPQVWG